MAQVLDVNGWRNGNEEARIQNQEYFFLRFWEPARRKLLNLLRWDPDFAKDFDLCAEDFVSKAFHDTFESFDRRVKRVPPPGEQPFNPYEGHFWNLMWKKIWGEVRGERKRRARVVPLDELVMAVDEEKEERRWGDVLRGSLPDPGVQILTSPQEQDRRLKLLKERLTRERWKLLKAHLEVTPENPPSRFDRIKKIYQEKHGKELKRGYYDKLNERLRKDLEKFNQEDKVL